jgi:quercetin dioxygenase-like cupin family protein
MTSASDRAESVADARRVREEAFTPVLIGQGRHLKAMRVCFEPGQSIPVHAPGVDLALVVLEGEGALVAGDEERVLSRGSLAFVPAGEERGIKAHTRLVTFEVVSPPPTEADHDRVREGLAKAE